MESSTPQLESSWLKALRSEFEQDYMTQLKKALLAEKKQYKVYPPSGEIFAAFNHTPFEQTKVVIIGQDPYHGPGQANGLSFSVRRGVKPPPSLVNIFKELQSDLTVPISNHGDLTSWADQGVLMLNAVLTVRHKTPGSHKNWGWQRFTNQAIQTLSENRENLVFLLWGSFARGKRSLVNSDKHRVLEAPHPSPFSAHNGFFGCRHFSKTNQYLQEHGLSPIKWELPE